MKINLPRSICPTSDEPNWLNTIETKEACKTWKRGRALTLAYSASKLRLWQLKKSKVVIVLFSVYWPKRDAAVDGWCRCTRAVYSSMWFVYYMACLPNRQCTHLLDTSWLQGCCFEILRVVSLGKFLVDLWFCWKWKNLWIWLRLAQILEALIPQSDWKLSIKTWMSHWK